MATNHKVFDDWMKRKLKVHPDRTELKVPHVIVRHMPHCRCPKPQPARRVHMGWNANSGPQFWEYDSREFKLWTGDSFFYGAWTCNGCGYCVYNSRYKGK